MAEHRLTAITPLGGSAPRIDQFEGLTITENTGTALASVASRMGQDKEFAAAAKKTLGFALPAAGQATGKGDYAAFSTGVDQWMVEAPFDTYEDVAARLASGLKATASITEQTDAWARFDVTGEACPALFERLCNVNIRTMQTGSATRTMIEHLGCFVICRAEGQSFSVLCPRSAAGSLHHALILAARSIA